ncbi:hypothetical protein HKD37_08G022950 [Glycine soja]
MGVEHQTSSVSDIHRTHVNESEEEFLVSRDYQSSLVHVQNKELENELENACKKQVESPNNNIEAEDVKEISHASEVEVKDVKLNHPKEVQVNSVSKGSNAAKTKNKSMLPTSKASPISTPKISKPASTTPTKPVTPASSTRKGSSPSLTMRQITSIEDKSLIKKQMYKGTGTKLTSNPNSDNGSEI